MHFRDMDWVSLGAPGSFAGGVWSIIALITLWSLIWKAFALWKTARRGDWVWFLVFLVVNTAGILELLYLFVFSEPKGLLKDTSNTVKGGEKKK